jgi:hypothetical protein
MITIPLYRVRLALGIVADSLSDHPVCTWGEDLQYCRYAFPVRSQS